MTVITKYKYIILSIIVVIFFFELLFGFGLKEGFEPNKYDPNTFANTNTNTNPNPNAQLVNKYSHSVNLPLTDPKSCQNACYNAKCSKTGEQCSTDVDCYQYGCESLLKTVYDKLLLEESLPKDKQNYVPIGVEETGRLIYNQNPQHSALTYDIGTTATIIDKDAQVPRPYRGVKIWEPVYNAKAKLLDDELAYQYAAEPEQYRSTPVYKPTLTATGLFYDIGPTAANASLN